MLWTSRSFTLGGAIVMITFLFVYTILAPIKWINQTLFYYLETTLCYNDPYLLSKWAQKRGHVNFNLMLFCPFLDFYYLWYSEVHLWPFSVLDSFDWSLLHCCFLWPIKIVRVSILPPIALEFPDRNHEICCDHRWQKTTSTSVCQTGRKLCLLPWAWLLGEFVILLLMLFHDDVSRMSLRAFLE